MAPVAGTAGGAIFALGQQLCNSSFDWSRKVGDRREVVIGAEATAGIGICFMPVTDTKVVKNRLHLDLAPGSPADREAEIERAIALGARLVDVGQTGSESWTVLADPEGNEFCVLRAKENLIN